jgi:signal transduction histidine kinase
MLRKLINSLIDLAAYIIRHPQFLITMLLVILIPIAFFYTGQLFLSVATENQERLEKDKLGVMHDIFAELVIAQMDDVPHIQEQITKITQQNPDITKFRLVEETPEGLLVIAAQNAELVGIYEEETDLYAFSSLENDDSLIFPYQNHDVRYWQVFRSVSITNTQYYIFTEVSFEQTDKLFANRILEAQILFLFIMFIVMYLAYRHLRLIDYSYLYKESQTSIKTRDLFTNMVTHELRAPLTAIRGYASMINEDKDVPFNTREQALRIQQSSERLLLIVNDLLEVARLQSGKLQIEKKEADICTTIKNVISALESSAREKEIVLSSDIQDQACLVNTDEKRFNQVLTNLVSNAIKYTPKGSINVVLKDKGREMEVRVQDTGMGIEAQDQQKLFAPFFSGSFRGC